MNAGRLSLLLLVGLAAGVIAYSYVDQSNRRVEVPGQREEVVFWHFWGGEDRAVVESVVARFNRSQQEYFVRAVAMPGNNLDTKLFLAITGGDPPDLINQDDPIVAEWASRGAAPLDELASEKEIKQLRDDFLFPAARRLGEYQGRMYALCNGLDIRALYYNRTLLGDTPAPQTPQDLSRIAVAFSLEDEAGKRQRFGYLPDSRRLWAWGVVFGGDFYDEQTGTVTAHDPPIVRALEWMQSFSRRFGAKEVAAFRTGDQSLPGKTFPLLPTSDDSPHGRYAVILDGQWRVRDIERSRRARQAAGHPVAQYGVWPLPAPAGGRQHAGWVNGNFFLVPRGAKNPRGAWEFMEFWSGFGGHQREAAETCVAGGWIPVSPTVVSRPEFQKFLRDQPLFAEFVKLAGSENQLPIPVIPGAALFDRQVKDTGGRAMADPTAVPRDLLRETSRRVQRHLDRR